MSNMGKLIAELRGDVAHLKGRIALHSDMHEQERARDARLLATRDRKIAKLERELAERQAELRDVSLRYIAMAELYEKTVGRGRGDND